MKLWMDVVGILPHRVTVYEHPQKELTIYLRWRVKGDWRRKSLGVKLRDERGKVRPEIRRMAISEAERQWEILSGRVALGHASDAKATHALTLRETWAVLAAKDGLYPVNTAHAKEVSHALTVAARIWGPTSTWESIDRAKLRMLMRQRVDELRAKGHDGYRGAELVMQRVLAVAAWLRDEERIPADACLPPRKWRDDLRAYWTQVVGREPTVERPRHSIAEMRKLLEVAPQVDPRFALLLALGAELRLGQVARCRRSDVSVDRLAHSVALRVPGTGKKRGTVVHLTSAQAAAFETAIEVGYLWPLEKNCADYPLFPQGQLPGGRLGHGLTDPKRHADAKPIERTAIRYWFREAERLAGIAHIPGRGAYGLRRAAVDGAKEQKISREGLQALGGWSDSQIPDSVYADQEQEYARDEAAKVRAKLRGESPT